jgi:hypothetical protein
MSNRVPASTDIAEIGQHGNLRVANSSDISSGRGNRAVAERFAVALPRALVMEATAAAAPLIVGDALPSPKDEVAAPL